MGEKRQMTVEDLYSFTFLGDPQVQPNGELVLYTQTTIDADSKEYRSRIWAKPLTDEEAFPFTSGPKSDSSPRWSPDGSKIAFVSDRSGTRQIWTMSVRGGEAQQLTFLKNGTSAPVWSPDGKWIAFTSACKPGEAVALEKDKKDEEKKDEVLVVNRLQYKSDGGGFWKGTYQQLFIVPAKGGEAKQLTFDEYNVGGLFWSADSTKIGFVSNRSDHPDLSFTSDIYMIDITGGDVQRLTDANMSIWYVKPSPDGKTLAFVGSDQTYKNATLARVYTVSAEGGEVTCITKDFDQYIGDVGTSDMRGGISNGNALLWSADGRSVFVLSSHHGNVHLYKVGLDGHTEQITQGTRQVYGFSYAAHKDQVVIASTTPTVPGDLYAVNLQDRTEQRLTNVNKGLLENVFLSEPEEFWYTSDDDWQVHGWIMKPYGYEEGKKYPAVLEIHGGPHTMYSNSFFHEFQVLASQGYVVVYTNPRGSHGYGQRFVDACRGDYGGKDYADIMNGLQYAIDHYTFIDADRLVVTGGSYGGFMTNWIVGHTDRFKAAVTQRSISNWLSFYGVSDIGYFFTEWQILGNPWDDVEKLWHHSPLKYVDNITTPLLILHSEQDYRCPIEQAEQLFIAIKRLGKTDTQLVRFPNSNHDLSRNGKPILRVERLNRIVGWFNQYIQK